MTWGFDGAHGTDVRPAHKATVHDWAKDPSDPTAQDGTRLGASLINRFVGNMRRLAQRFSVSLTEDGDDDLADCVVAAIGATAPAAHNHDAIYPTIEAVDVALALKAPLASPTFTGVPSAPTPAPGTNTTQIATTEFVLAVRDALLNSAPGALDTLDELAAALGDDASFATTVTNTLALKAPLASPVLTGTPAAPTPDPGTNTTQIATTEFVSAAIGAIASGVVSFNSRTGAVAPANDDYAVGNLAAIADGSIVGNNTGVSARPLALTAGQVRTLLSLVVGTDVQAYDADLAAIAAFAPTKGRILVGDGSAWQALAAGTNGYALVADSAEATGLKYASAGGGITEISSSTISSGVASVEFSGTWSYKRLTVVGFGLSGNSAVTALRVQISDDDGATYETVHFAYSYYDSVGTAVYTARTTSNVVTVLTYPNNLGPADDDHAFRCAIFDAAGSASRKTIDATGASYDSTAWTAGIGVTAAACAAINRIKITYTSGNLDAGVIKLYGE